MSTITEAQPVGLARLRQIDPLAVQSFAFGLITGPIVIARVLAIAIPAGLNHAQEAL